MQKIPHIRKASIGEEISILGLGGFHQLEVTSEIVAKTIHYYLEYGGNYIETARLYGNGASETKIGNALKGHRDSVFLVSKSIERTADKIRIDLENSLKVLHTDHLDYYYMHMVNTDDEIKQLIGDDGALTALLKAKKEGLIGGIGFSSHRPWIYIEALQTMPLDIILIWNNYLEDLYLPEIRRDIIPLAKKKGCLVSIMKPLADGYLYRSAESALRWVLDKGSDIIICGFNSVEQLKQNITSINKGPLTQEEEAKLMQKSIELGHYVCRQCKHCAEELKDVFRLEGYLDRQMLDWYPHDPADYALRLRLSGWFRFADIAQERYAAKKFDETSLRKAAKVVQCPYGIDVERKFRLASFKLRGENPQLL